MERLAVAAPQRTGSPLHVVALLARAAGGLDADAGDALGVRRHRAAARRLAATALSAAAGINGAFGDRPDPALARARALAAIRERAAQPGDAPVRALGELARIALELPATGDDGGDWQLGAIAFADETTLRALHEACLAMAAAGVREAAGA